MKVNWVKSKSVLKVKVNWEMPQQGHQDDVITLTGEDVLNKCQLELYIKQ